MSNYQSKQYSKEDLGNALIYVITDDLKNLQLDQVAVLFPQLVSFLKWFCFVNL